MKTLSIFTYILCASTLAALEPVNTFTFADPCKPHVTIATVPNTYGCFSFTASNSALSKDNTYYSWKFGDGASTTGTYVSHCYAPANVAKVYTGTLTFHTPALCGVQSTSTNFTISVAPPPTGTCIAAGPEILKSGLTVSVQGGVSIPEMMRSIDYGDGGGYINEGTHTYEKCGNYILTYKSWDMNAPEQVCYGYTAVNLECKDMPADLPDRIRAAARVYPNPVADDLHIETQREIRSVAILDLLRREHTVFPEKVAAGVSLGTGHLEGGTFIVKILYLDNSVDFVRILKE